jgi:hypothetical protein
MPAGGRRAGAGRKAGGKNRIRVEIVRPDPATLDGTCLYCGTPGSVKPGKWYCSGRCAARHRNQVARLLRGTCAFCGTPESVEPGAIYCSFACAGRGRSAVALIKKPDRACAHCGASIREKQNKCKYCSHACAVRADSARKMAGQNRSCQFCGSGFVKKKRSAYCSRVCYQRYRAVLALQGKRRPTPRVCACGTVPENKYKAVCERCLEQRRRLADARRRLAYEAKKQEKREANRRRIRPARVCPCCGTSFHPQHDKRLYCSPRCGRRITKAGRYPLLGSLPRGPDRDALAQFIATVKAMRISIDHQQKERYGKNEATDAALPK